MKLRILSAAVAATALSAVAPAGAQQTPGLVVVPRPASQLGRSYFALHAGPGASASAGAVELRNPTGAAMRVVLAPVDGKTLGALGSTYAPPGSRPHGSTLWLALGAREVRLPPHAAVSVPLSVNVPAGAAPGDYLSGLSIEQLGQAASQASRKGVSIASVSRYVVGTEVSVPGPRRPLIVFTGARVEQQPAGLVFQLLARNSGNVILKGVYGSVQISRSGQTVLARPIEAGTFVSHTAIAYPVNAFTEHPAEGTRYRIKAILHYAGGVATLDTTVSFGHRQAAIQRQYGAAPAKAGGMAWWKIAAIAAVLLYALGTTALLVRRRGGPRPARTLRGRVRRRGRDPLTQYAQELARAEAGAALATDERPADDRQPA